MTTASGGSRQRTAQAGLLSVALLLAGATLAFIAMRGPDVPRSEAERVRAVASALRCPVCQNLSVADSPSPLAREMRATIARELRAGKTPDQVKAGFVEAYGEWILLSPPRRGLNLVAWMAPVLLLAGGVAAAAFAIRRWTARDGGLHEGAGAVGSDGRESSPGLTSDDRQMLERALAAVPEEPA